MFRKTLTAFFLAALAAASPQAKDLSSVTIAAPWEVASFDPAVSGFAYQRLQVFETLVDADADGALRPGLATLWTASEDGLTWTFTLRDGVAFHDGTAMDAGTVAASLTRSWEQPGVLKKAPITGIEAGEGSVRVTLEKPFAALPAMLAHATTTVTAPASRNDEGVSVAAIGTGPFKVDTAALPQSVTLARNETYWGDAATLEKVTYLASGRAETRALLAESGDADMVFTLDPSGYARLGTVGSVRTLAVPIPRVVTLKVNAGHPFLNDARARQALSLAIDRAGIAAAITRFPEAGASQLFPPALDTWHDGSLPALGFDPDRATALLADLGWAPGDDGILTRDGERFSILLRTFPDRPELPLIAAALQDQWKSVGIDLEVSVSNYSEIPAGHKDGSLHVALFARNYGLTPDPIGTVLADFGKGGGDWGAMNWENPAVDAALAKVAATDDVAMRAPEIATVVQALHTELPIIPIVWYQHTASVAVGLQGVVIDPLERSYGLSSVKWSE